MWPYNINFFALPIAECLNFVTSEAAEAPTVKLKNGTYIGPYSSTYKQDLFLVIPFAQVFAHEYCGPSVSCW
jgi:hypothetical protein